MVEQSASRLKAAIADPQETFPELPLSCWSYLAGISSRVPMLALLFSSLGLIIHAAKAVMDTASVAFRRSLGYGLRVGLGVLAGLLLAAGPALFVSPLPNAYFDDGLARLSAIDPVGSAFIEWTRRAQTSQFPLALQIYDRLGVAFAQITEGEVCDPTGS